MNKKDRIKLIIVKAIVVSWIVGIALASVISDLV